VLPNNNLFETHFSDYFVLFKPKDIVSGDFYWIAHVENQTIVAAADCTGHGVPGAFMSMIGAAFLNEIINKEYITHPGVILNRLRKEIMTALDQHGNLGEQKDGMDISLISYNNESKKLQWAGANNPLYIISKENFDDIQESTMDLNEYKLFEIKPDKMPIAVHVTMDRFKMHEIQLHEGDFLYMFSDGYADQFGGPKGKKFKYKPFKKLLLENAAIQCQEQKDILDKTMQEWISYKNPDSNEIIEQIDDIVVVGLKV
jgi:serine phosphatase RsbU (regulator of sigma subunit)